jgi:hypothetical protein
MLSSPVVPTCVDRTSTLNVNLAYEIKDLARSKPWIDLAHNPTSCEMREHGLKLINCQIHLWSDVYTWEVS